MTSNTFFPRATAKMIAKTIAYYSSFSNSLKENLKYISQGFQNVVSRALLPLKFSLVFLPLLSLAFFWSLTAPAQAQSTVLSPALSPKQVVEYALTLEKLEADFYRRGGDAARNGGLAAAPQIAKDAIASYGEDEANHVTDLSAVLRKLGGNPDAITIPPSPNYSAILGRDPFTNPTDFLLAGQYVEDLGVAAYKGQVQNLLAAGDAGKPVLAAALEIHSVEARHAAGVRFLRQTLLGADVRPWISTNASSSEVIYNENRPGLPIPFSLDAFDGYATKEEVLALVAPILNVAQQSTQSGQSTTTNMGKPAEPVRALW